MQLKSYFNIHALFFFYNWSIKPTHSQPSDYANNIILSIFMTMKSTILDTHSINNNGYNKLSTHFYWHLCYTEVQKFSFFSFFERHGFQFSRSQIWGVQLNFLFKKSCRSQFRNLETWGRFYQHVYLQRWWNGRLETMFHPCL